MKVSGHVRMNKPIERKQEQACDFVGTEYSCSVRFARPIYTRGGSAELLKIRDMQTPEGSEG
jgi:hypothetical protein